MNIHVINVRGLRNRAGVVYVGRRCAGWPASPLGNPFRIGADCSREQSVAQYEDWLRAKVKEPGCAEHREMVRLYRLAEHQPLVLGCWCAPLPCHAEVIKKLLLEAEDRQRQKLFVADAKMYLANGVPFWDVVGKLAESLGCSRKEAASILSKSLWADKKAEAEREKGVIHLPGIS